MSTFISLERQAEVIAKIKRMAAESMNPHNYVEFTKQLAELADTRNITHMQTLVATDDVAELKGLT